MESIGRKAKEVYMSTVLHQVWLNNSDSATHVYKSEQLGERMAEGESQVYSWNENLQISKRKKQK